MFCSIPAPVHLAALADHHALPHNEKLTTLGACSVPAPARLAALADYHAGRPAARQLPLARARAAAAAGARAQPQNPVVWCARHAPAMLIGRPERHIQEPLPVGRPARLSCIIVAEASGNMGAHRGRGKSEQHFAASHVECQLFHHATMEESCW